MPGRLFVWTLRSVVFGSGASVMGPLPRADKIREGSGPAYGSVLLPGEARAHLRRGEGRSRVRRDGVRSGAHAARHLLGERAVEPASGRERPPEGAHGAVQAGA